MNTPREVVDCTNAGSDQRGSFEASDEALGVPAPGAFAEPLPALGVRSHETTSSSVALTSHTTGCNNREKRGFIMRHHSPLFGSAAGNRATQSTAASAPSSPSATYTAAMSTTMFKSSRRTLPAILAASLCMSMAACEDKTAPASAGGGGGGGGPLGNLAESPQSLLGKSAGSGRDVADKIKGAQDDASNLANDVSGQANVVSAGALNFTVPEAWTKKTPDKTKFQAAAFEIPSASDGPPMQVVFFGSIRGNVASNVERWRGQVQKEDGSKAEAKVETATANGLSVTMVTMNGAYSGMTGNAIPDAGFRAALVDVGGGEMVCVRLTGLREDVEARTEEFWTAVKTAKK